MVINTDKNDISPNLQFTWDISDFIENIPITIALWDDDSPWSDDDNCDISATKRNCDITYTLKRGSWSWDDSIGDTNGYGYVSGREDGSTAEPDGNWDNHQDDCALWFDAYQNDYDGDGMPYGWEIEYGLNPSVNDGSSDKDGDGATNYQEWKIGKNPTKKDIKGFHLTVSFNWNVDSTYMNDFVAGMRLASSYLFDVTDGYMFISKVTFYDNVNTGNVNWDNADIRVYKDANHPDVSTFSLSTSQNNVYPQSHPGGIVSTSYHIFLPHHWNGNSFPWDYSWKNSKAYRTIIHEFGHYGLFLRDEYEDAEGDAYPKDAEGVYKGPPGMMNYQYKYSEMTTEVDYTAWSPPAGYSTTEHCHFTGESCWKTVFRKYNHNNGEYIQGIEFDLNKDGTADTSFFTNYVANSGPVDDVGEVMIANVYNT